MASIAAPPTSTLLGRIRNELRLKIYLGLLLMFALAFIVSLAAYGSQTADVSAVDRVVEIDQRIAVLEAEINDHITSARRFEQGYLLDYRELGFRQARFVYVTSWQSEVDSAREKLNEILVLSAEREPDTAFIARVNLILNALSIYETNALQIIDLIEVRGFRDDGLEGEFRATIHAVEDFLDPRDLRLLEVHMLWLRREEKDFLLFNDSADVDEMLMHIDMTRDDIAVESALTVAEKEQLNSLLSDYWTTFSQMVDVNRQIDEVTVPYLDAVQTMETETDLLLKQTMSSEALVQNRVFNISRRGTAVIAGASLLALFLGPWIAGQIAGLVTRQIDELLALFNKINAGDLSARANIVSRDELGDVAEALNFVLDENAALIQTRDERARIEQSILGLVNDMEGIAGGDLTQEAEVSADVTGAIADSFNFMVEQLRDVIEQVQQAALEVNASADEIQTTAEQLSEGSNFQASQLVGTTAAIDEMSVSIQQVSRNANVATAIGKEAQNEAATGSQAVQDVVDGLVRVSDEVEKTNEYVLRLQRDSAEMADIVRLIGNVTERTGVLALNAAIEATQTENAGRGFGLVASEVEQLSQQSATVNREIAGLVRSIQTQARSVANTMNETRGEINAGLHLANDAGERLMEIEIIATQLSNLIQSIAQSAQQQARGSENISHSMNEIAQLTRESAQTTHRTSGAIEHLTKLADNLTTSVSRFKLVRTQ